MKRFFLTSLVVGLFFSPLPALAAGTIFVPKGAGSAWWTSDLSLLPLGETDGGVSVLDVDNWINTNRGMKSETKTCFMSFIKDDEIVAPDRETHTEIRSKLAEFPRSFAQWLEPSQGAKFLIRVGIFEDCVPKGSTDEPLRYMAVVITDENNKIRDFDALDWNFIRLFKASGGTISVFGCFNCGDRRELSWDEGNDRFYYRWTGH